MHGDDLLYHECIFYVCPYPKDPLDIAGSSSRDSGRDSCKYLSDGFIVRPPECQAKSQAFSAAVQQAANTVYGVGAQYGVMLPFSRKHESEADYMGLVFMTMAGYNPDVAVNFWQKMSAGKSGSTPEFMSTHPSDATRIAEIQKVLPAIKTKYKK